MGLNRKQRSRAYNRKWAFAFERKDLYHRQLEGNAEKDLMPPFPITLEQSHALGFPLLKDATGSPVPTGEHIKEPVTATLSWITPHIQHSANHRRDKERISTYGAPLRILHNRAKYLEYLNPKAA